MSRKESSLELAIRTHYQILDFEDGMWDKDRVHRLCSLLHITLPELATLIRVKPSSLDRYSSMPGRMPAAMKLLLDLVERAALSKYLGVEHKTSLFPDL